jgi:dihydrodipicolinate synthase/N-acetylneuraminate lyase
MSVGTHPPGGVRAALRRGGVIPAHPLALTAARQLDERRQRALTRYYLSAGATGVAVGVHTTQFALHDPRLGLYEPVLALTAETAREHARARGTRPILVAGLIGQTAQAVTEAGQAVELGYQAGLLSLAAMREADDDGLIAHCAEVARIIPLFGFYLQPAVGGRRLSLAFWRRFVAIDGVVAIKVAPFNRYQTLDVVRAVAEVGRSDEIALYTGNDDHVVEDLLETYRLPTPAGSVELRFVGGLLGHWAVWTRRAVELCEQIGEAVTGGAPVPASLLVRATEVTDSNAALFDAANGFAGCIAGLHEILRRQGLMQGRWCLDPDEDLSPGQMEEIERVCQAYPHLRDDDFVAAHLDEWLS